MFSTSSKIVLGYIVLVGLLMGAFTYTIQQMNLLTTPTNLRDQLDHRRHITHRIISQLYDAEIIGQTLRTGNLDEYHHYLKAMKEVNASIDTLEIILTDTLQQARLDTVRTLLRNKQWNMYAVLEAMRNTPTDQIYQEQLDSLIAQQDSLLSTPHVRRKVITHHNSYTIHHKKKGFFKRLADVFAPGKEDSTQVSNVIQEEYTDTLDEVYSPIDTISHMITGIQHKVFQTRQKETEMLNTRINSLRIVGSGLSQRVNQLLENIEHDEQEAARVKLMQEEEIRKNAAKTMAHIAIAAFILVLVFSVVIARDITRNNHYRKELEKAKKKAEKEGKEYVEPTVFLPVDVYAPGTMDIYDYISLTFTEPLATAADGAIHLKQKVDSLWNDVPYDFVPDSLNLMRYNVYADWVPGESYAFEVDSTAFHGIYGLFTDKIKKEFKVKKPEEYGQIFYNVTGADSIAFVELLDAQDKVVRTVPVVDGKADFYFLNPGKYSARLINDTNGNGVWDTGKYEDKRQPEKVYYYPQVIELKANFDLTQDWNIHEKPLDKQKPDELKKQKPDEDKKKRNQNNRSSGNNR